MYSGGSPGAWVPGLVELEEMDKTGVKEMEETGVKETEETGVEDMEETGVEETEETGVEEMEETDNILNDVSKGRGACAWPDGVPCMSVG